MEDPRKDPFLSGYSDPELRIVSEFLTTWLPFLSKDVCQNCTHILQHRILNLTSSNVNGGEKVSCFGESSVIVTPINNQIAKHNDKCDTHSLGSWKDEADSNSLSSWKDGANDWSELPVAADTSSNELIHDAQHIIGAPKVHMSWADMAQEDELEGDGYSDENKRDINGKVSNGEPNGLTRIKTELSREQREFLRLQNVHRKKDFICLQRIDGKLTNILQGLELHAGVFSAVEQKNIVHHIYELMEKGRNGELKERTFMAPRKWMKGKGRVTIQFGCCYNYATDKKGNPPGILRRDEVDPLPSMFKVMIRRLIRWGVLPPSCIPDSCIVNIYDEGDCIPPHIDNHDFVRPFCTISFLSECNILFGTDLKIEGPGEFTGDFAIPLPVGSVLVLNGNGADVAKHCVPAVPSKRISITFRRMDESKRPVYYAPDPDLQGLKPLSFDDKGSNKSSSSSPSPRMGRGSGRGRGRQGATGGFRSERQRPEEPRYSARSRSFDDKGSNTSSSSSIPPQMGRGSGWGKQGTNSGFSSERQRPDEQQYSSRSRGPFRGVHTRIYFRGG